LSRHLRRQHNHDCKQEIDSGKDLYYKCEECDEKFSNRCNMQRHGNDKHLKMIG
jgi:hypothetical protein